MIWNPGIPLRQNVDVYRVSATDAEVVGGERFCPLSLALKVRPKTIPETGDWALRKSPFVLGALADAIKRVGWRTNRGSDLWQTVEEQKSIFADLHDGVRQFLEHGLDRYFEYHEAREELIGRLSFLDGWVEAQKAHNASLFAWAFLYETSDGYREIRRLRHSSAQAAVTSWAYVAAHVAAEYPSQIPAQRVWVTEIGLADGIENHLLEGVTPDDARRLYEERARSDVRATLRGEERVTSRSCGECKFTGACDSLIRLDGFLQARQPGPWTRSVSASDLEAYERCPAQWYMEREAHLPRSEEGNQALLRGLAAHQWIAQAHTRGIPCSIHDLPDPADLDRLSSIANGPIDPADYELAYPFLRAHIECCPLEAGIRTSLVAERTLYAYDAEADVVIATKADAFWVRDDMLTMREIKTVQTQPDANEDQIFSAFLSVAWDLVAIEAGLADHYGVTHGEVQLEVLSPDSAAVYAYSTRDTALMKMARGRVRRLARQWLNDTQWDPLPNPGCSRCSVRRWCGARDAYASSVASRVTTGTGSIPVTPQR
ncbi:PD-(D/E)XK nuclease family protein [Micromonospora sp. NPDC004551]|uniref:PD-(D/E)XK nuclease family protein n=1 Tax=Micromonospora sp. NPDC004551 TaxID=3154284 RepID=UPI0033B3A29E